MIAKVSLVLCAFLRLANCYGVATPPPPGPYAVGTVSLEAIDQKRLDPYAPTPQPRALMTSFFYPTTDTKKQFAPYLPLNLAAFADKYFGFPPGFTENIRSQSFLNARAKEIPDIPIILFSPGLGGVRETYTILSEGLASYGYMVVAIDHTYDAAAVEFPDGTLIEGLATINGDAQALDTRTKDTIFIMNQLSNTSFISQIPGIVHRNFANSKIAMFGHSLGGATTLQAMEHDSRILGGVNLDGPFSGAMLHLGTSKPFLNIGRANHTRFNDPAWAEVWKHLTGFRAELTLANSTHFTFVDEPAIFTEVGLIGELDPGGAMYGTINGLRATVVEIAYLKSFFDFVLKGGKDTMFKKADPAFPEITIV